MSIEGRARIKRLTNTYADDFERALILEGPFKEEGRLMNKRTEKIIAFLSSLNVRRLLDVGCGPGVVAVKISKRLGIEVDAVDFAERQVEKARELIAREQAKVRIFCEDILAPSLNSELSYKNYDAVLCKDVVGAYSLSGKREIIKQLVNYAKPAGHILMSVFSCEKEPQELHSETPESYKQIIMEITKKEPYIERMDEKALFIHVRL